jgi:hypothetical protein
MFHINQLYTSRWESIVSAITIIVGYSVKWTTIDQYPVSV